MTQIRVGDTVPDLRFTCVQGGIVLEAVAGDYFKGKSVLFGLPGAFTPVCNDQQLPSFVANCALLKAQGFDRIICLAVNDPFVMQAWAKTTKADALIDFIADWDAQLTKALGLDIDLGQAGLGIRAQRFNMQLDGLTVQSLVIEDSPGVCEKTNAANILK
ncbi:MAG: peroxiredoxin [Alphaproteobacteria bacterium]